MELVEEDVQMTLGGRIALARENNNFTEQQLSRRLGVMVKTVHNWEADRSAPRGNKMAMLCGVLGVSLGWLVTGENSDDENPETFEETKTLQTNLDQLLALHEQSSALIFEIQSDIIRLQAGIDQENARFLKSI